MSAPSEWRTEVVGPAECVRCGKLSWCAGQRFDGVCCPCLRAERGTAAPDVVKPQPAPASPEQGDT